MEKEIFKIVCSLRTNDNGFSIDFGIEGVSAAKEAFGQESYENYLEKIIEIVKPVTLEMNDVTFELLTKSIEKEIEESNKKVFEMFTKALKEGMKGE